MERFNSYLRCGLLLVALCVVGGVGWKLYSFVDSCEKSTFMINATLLQANRTLARIDNVAQTYEDQLTSDRSRKALQASLEAAAAWKATAQLVNVTVIPNINRTLLSLSQTTNSLNRFVEDQNGNTADVLRSITKTVGTVEGSVKGLQSDSHDLLAGVNSTTRSVEGLARGLTETTSAATAVLSEMRGSMSELRAASAQLRVASEQAPLVAEDVQRIIHSASRWQSALRIIGIILSAGAILR